ncbi:putative membrane protein [Candidatus Phytoplasma solani]
MTIQKLDYNYNIKDNKIIHLVHEVILFDRFVFYILLI